MYENYVVSFSFGIAFGFMIANLLEQFRSVRGFVEADQSIDIYQVANQVLLDVIRGYGVNCVSESILRDEILPKALERLNLGQGTSPETLSVPPSQEGLLYDTLEVLVYSYIENDGSSFDDTDDESS